MNLTKAKTTILIGSVALVLIGGLGWTLVLSPRQGDISDIKAQTVAAEAFNELQRRDLEALRLQAANLGAQQAYAEGLTTRFPTTAAQPELFAEVQAAAARAGLSDRSVIALTPSAPLPGTAAAGGAAPLPPTADSAGGVGTSVAPDVASMQLEVTVTGPYEALLVFIAEMENNPRAFLVSTVDVAAVGEAGTSSYTLTLTGAMFVLPPLTDPDAAANGDPP